MIYFCVMLSVNHCARMTVWPWFSPHAEDTIGRDVGTLYTPKLPPGAESIILMIWCDCVYPTRWRWAVELSKLPWNLSHCRVHLYRNHSNCTSMGRFPTWTQINCIMDISVALYMNTITNCMIRNRSVIKVNPRAVSIRHHKWPKLMLKHL